ncbi:hypothetical protein M441DRAFT_445789 [Trichoderma asperellum CBS 433.97]|uniref:Uncharacterized protein n=1 Tax=Trichoderma asperellum (strain ATCC 204424 / CBS 433.97 / NBRC 101777) TaxID=1042311 RepID=A0A2T3ZQS7_TRIA4|nr:hypothetical protein M441DRAFT_445789 [Trichoderma asperellum CBS 433.97]PTB47156.1 hypothetical protein M441DRAFT_445789 [Trichoderma asperellum CBS 433.97]
MQEQFGAYANRLEPFHSAASYMRLYGGSTCSGTEADSRCNVSPKPRGGTCTPGDSLILFFFFFSHFFYFVHFSFFIYFFFFSFLLKFVSFLINPVTPPPKRPRTGSVIDARRNSTR